MVGTRNRNILMKKKYTTSRGTTALGRAIHFVVTTIVLFHVIGSFMNCNIWWNNNHDFHTNGGKTSSTNFYYYGCSAFSPSSQSFSFLRKFKQHPQQILTTATTKSLMISQQIHGNQQRFGCSSSSRNNNVKTRRLCFGEHVTTSHTSSRASLLLFVKRIRQDLQYFPGYGSRTTSTRTLFVSPSSTTRSSSSTTVLSSNVNDNYHEESINEGVDDIESKNFSFENLSSRQFDLTTALFCAGLAFDAYAEPDKNSPRWEKGAAGLNIAFMSTSFTRSLYRGLIEITPKNVTDLPNESDGVENVLSGGGVDPYFLVAVSEGKWGKEDSKIVEDRFSKGVLDLTGSAHICRSTTAWSNINKNVALKNKERNDKGIINEKSMDGQFSTAYYEKSTWGKGGRGFWLDEPPQYIYVREPDQASLVITIMDEDIVGSDDVIGSTSIPLSSILPLARSTNMKDLVSQAKKMVLEKVGKSSGAKGVVEDMTISAEDIQNALVQQWEGTLKLKTKPRKEDKKGQVALGVAAGALVAGPAGAAVGGFIGNMLEEDVRGVVGLKVRYLPIPAETNVERKRYEVKGGLPGVDWGKLYFSHLKRMSRQQQQQQEQSTSSSSVVDAAGDDLEICAFVTHEVTGCSCVLYRSLEKRMIAVSFRGTCAPIDLITDASILQTPWIEGTDLEKKQQETNDDNNESTDTTTSIASVPMVHQGFRNSLNSVARRLKELILAAVKPGDDLKDYQLLITGHSLGGALATLFAADVSEYGCDAGRGLPQVKPSDPWWNTVVTRFFSKDGTDGTPTDDAPPPRPKTIKLYSFGSPRVGNDAFVKMFDELQISNKLDECYRVVNNADVVARLPRTVNVVLGSVGYDHCGATALITLPKQDNQKEKSDIKQGEAPPLVWVEGESDDNDCPVRDGTPLTSPLGEGMLLGDLFDAVKGSSTTTSQSQEESDQTSSSNASPSKEEKREQMTNRITNSWSQIAAFKNVAERLQSLEATDIVSIFGIDKKYAEREAKIIASIASGEAISHHMEDEYYLAMGRACGYIARVGEELIEIEDVVVGDTTTTTNNADASTSTTASMETL